MGGKEQTYVQQAFDTNWIAPVGPNLEAFEKSISDYMGGGHTAGLSSGTAAIHLALIILGVQPGDEVICSSFTFSASANPILYQKAIPVFVDSELDTWNMSPALLDKAISERLAAGKKPKAIIVAHLYGQMAKMEAIMTIAQQHEIPVIEDAAEALGAKYKDQLAGSFGDIGIFSFNGNKIITTSGGGALYSCNEAYVKKARFLATQARDTAPHYQHSEVGYNYRLSNISAGIGRGQMEVLNDRIASRRANFDYYQKAFADISGLQFSPEPEAYYSNRWLSCITIDGIGYETVLKIADHMNAANIEVRPLWKPLHLQPIFNQYPKYVDGTAETLFGKGLCLPSGSNMTEDQLKRVVKELRSAFEQFL